jgi:hypothetical protein
MGGPNPQKARDPRAFLIRGERENPTQRREGAKGAKKQTSPFRGRFRLKFPQQTGDHHALQAGIPSAFSAPSRVCVGFLNQLRRKNPTQTGEDARAAEIEFGSFRKLVVFGCGSG